LQSVLDCVVETVAVFDLEGRLLLSNPAFERTFGHFGPRATVDVRRGQYGLLGSDGITPLPAEESPSRRAIRGETVEDLELIVTNQSHPGGLVMSTNARALHDGSGAVVGAVVTGRDVTARKLAERELRDQSRLLTSILDCLAEAVVVYDPAGRLVLSNPAAVRVLDPAVGMTMTIEDRARLYGLSTVDGTRALGLGDTAAARALRGEACDDVELLMRSPTFPEGRPFSTSSRPLRDPEGKVLGVVVTIRDITARRRAEREKEDMLQELRRSNDELARFASAASHDLRAPLRAIDHLAAWLEEDLARHFTARTAQHMQTLRSRVRRMETLLHDLLAFAKVGRGAIDVAAVDVDRLVAEAIELAAPPDGFRIQRAVEVPSFETAAVPLKRVLINVIGNAVKHHDRPDGQIAVAVRDDGPFVVFEIADDGPGIPPPYHQRVFEMFETLKPRDQVEGSGMGLAIVKRVVEVAQGEITLVSDGRGATFRVRWPRIWPAARA
jgi:signal transduction histidine kinase